MSGDTIAPIRVSPFIKLARWSLLVLGVWYGTKRWNALHRREEKYRDHLREMKPIWDAEKAEAKRLAEMKELEDLKKQGIDLGS